MSYRNALSGTPGLDNHSRAGRGWRMRDKTPSAARAKIGATVTTVVHDNSCIDGFSIGGAAIGSVGFWP
jgi:hypothetical protein